ncbi:MAG: acyltransferase family protein [Bacteroidales bacterium]|nr:acyltransferase family protein [Bacteroidales bacterium]
MERKYWIDWAKVFGIYLVVLGHTTDGSELIRPLIYSFHMPLFFMISGYLEKKYSGSAISYIKKTAKRLLIPYLIYGIISTLYVIFIVGSKDTIHTLLCLCVGRPQGFAGPLWFVPVLFEIKIINMFLEYVESHLRLHRISVLTMIGGGILIIILHVIGIKPHWLLLPIVSYPFFIIGKIFKNNELYIDAIPKSAQILVCSILILIPLIGAKFNGCVELYDCSLGKSVILFYIVGILSSVGFMSLFRLAGLHRSRLIETLSNGTIMILSLHSLLLIPFDIHSCSLWFRIAYSAVVVLAFYYPICYSIRSFPLLIGKTKIKI